MPLFEHYTSLADKLLYVSLGGFPASVQGLHKLGSDLRISQRYLKKGKLTSKVYGGNKPRKLESCWVNIIKVKVKEVIAFGCAGSNHALATTIYAR